MATLELEEKIMLIPDMVSLAKPPLLPKLFCKDVESACIHNHNTGRKQNKLCIFYIRLMIYMR